MNQITYEVEYHQGFDIDSESLHVTTDDAARKAGRKAAKDNPEFAIYVTFTSPDGTRGYINESGASLDGKAYTH